MFKRHFGSALLIGLVLALPAQAEYASIQVNLVNLVPDTTYSGGWLTVDEDLSTGVTLNDPPNTLSATLDNISFFMTSEFQNVFLDNGDVKAHFAGGNMELTFDYDSSPYYISGPISDMVFGVTGTFTIGGEGLFDAAWDLPGSNNWPAPLLSSLKTLTFAFGQDLSTFDWTSDLLSGNVQSQITILPDDSAVPDPATLLLVLPGLALLRRR